MTDLETGTIRKVTWRLMPFLMICYFVAFLDRVNVGFAHLQMSQSLGMSEVAFGFGAGVFFIGYFLVEVPSNVLLVRFGARVWIARIMLSWGLVSTCFGFIPQLSSFTGLSADTCFYLLRFLLGLCEAGFYPGVVYYLTRWFPEVYRARAIAFFMLAVPVSSVIGAPLSGALLNVAGLGLQGWQWLYILEGLPSVLLSAAVWAYLTDHPRDAGWLRMEEIDWLQEKISEEQALAGKPGRHDDDVPVAATAGGLDGRIGQLRLDSRADRVGNRACKISWMIAHAGILTAPSCVATCLACYL